ncbi:MAG: acyl-CoA dehydrogenase [Gammaproteobacteria bacterium]
MLDYNAPLRDMRFVLNELIGFERIGQLQGCDEINQELSDAVLEEASKLASDVLAPLNRVGDIEGSKLDGSIVTTPTGWKDAYNAFRESGWCSLSMNPEYGGQGFPKVIATAVAEMWDSSNMSFSLCPLLTNGAIEAVEQHGDALLKSLYLEKLVSGEWAGTMNLTEPQAGSDLSTVRTKATPSGNHYLIQGQKIYITYGEHDLTGNIIHLVLARTPDAPAGTKGISLFVVPKYLVNSDGSLGDRNDLRCISLEHKLGIHASPTAVMSYGDQGGAVGYLVGEENKGLMYMFTMMNAARHAVGREGMAIAEASYQLALKYAQTRVQGNVTGDQENTNTIIGHPDVKRMLMLMKSQVEAMRAVNYLCAFEYDLAERHGNKDVRALAERRGDLLTPIVKGWSTEIGQKLTSVGVQIHGGMGFVEETGAAQYLRDSRITTIYEGTTGIQAADLVGRKTLRDGGKAIRELIADMKETLNVMNGDDKTLEIIRDSFAQSLEDLEYVVDWLLANASDPRLAAAAASSYLHLVGITCGGWLLARSAVLGVAKLNDGTTDTVFYTAKIDAARFYATQVLPETSALRTAIAQGSETIADLGVSSF